MAVSRKRKDSRPKPEQISELVNKASEKDSDTPLKPKSKRRKLAKSKDPNYTKLTVYLPTDLISTLKVCTAKDSTKDLSEMTEYVMNEGLKRIDGLTD